MSESTIKRCPHDRENKYVVISQTLLKDEEISFKAKGFLCYLLSFPDDWKVNPQYIAKKFGIGKGQVYSIIKELIQVGYCKREAIKDEQKRVVRWDFEISESKRYKNPSTIQNEPLPQNPEVDNPDLENEDYNKYCIEQSTDIEKVMNNDDSFLPFSNPEDEAAKLQLLKPYPLSSSLISKILVHPLERIRTSLRAYEQWIEKRGKPPTSIEAPIMKSIINGWQPAITAEEIQEIQENDVRKYQEILNARRDEIRQMLRASEGKLPFKFSFSAGENEVTLREDSRFTPVSYAENDVIKIVQKHMNKYWIKE